MNIIFVLALLRWKGLSGEEGFLVWSSWTEIYEREMRYAWSFMNKADDWFLHAFIHHSFATRVESFFNVRDVFYRVKSCFIVSRHMSFVSAFDGKRDFWSERIDVFLELFVNVVFKNWELSEFPQRFRNFQTIL